VGLRQDSRTSAPYPDSDKTAFQEIPVYWLVLILSGVLEAVWATALGRSDGFTRLAPGVVFAVALAASMAGLAYAMRGLPVGTAYAVWVGIGAALTAGYAMWSGQEPVSVVRVLLLAGIVGCVIGLKVTH
jgi:quaternary ammonium compound-resistance protein SugE